MENTDPALVHLLLDTGHLAFAGDDPVDAARVHADRIKHVHLKDVRPDVVATATAEGYSFEDGDRGGRVHRARRRLDRLRADPRGAGGAGFEGWLVVEAEQDPAKANPLEYALKARRLPARGAGLVTSRELYFSFFMFTADLRPGDRGVRGA